MVSFSSINKTQMVTLRSGLPGQMHKFESNELHSENETAYSNDALLFVFGMQVRYINVRPSISRNHIPWKEHVV
jgi:hypothetical protein